MTRRAGAPTYGWGSLTPAEASVISELIRGLTNPEIGRQLGISRRTVATHLEHILAKLNVRSRVDVVREAIISGGTEIILPGIPPGMTPAEFHYQRGLADARRTQAERTEPVHAMDCDGPGCTYDGCICWYHAREIQ